MKARYSEANALSSPSRDRHRGVTQFNLTNLIKEHLAMKTILEKWGRLFMLPYSVLVLLFIYNLKPAFFKQPHYPSYFPAIKIATIITSV